MSQDVDRISNERAMQAHKPKKEKAEKGNKKKTPDPLAPEARPEPPPPPSPPEAAVVNISAGSNSGASDRANSNVGLGFFDAKGRLKSRSDIQKEDREIAAELERKIHPKIESEEEAVALAQNVRDQILQAGLASLDAFDPGKSSPDYLASLLAD